MYHTTKEVNELQEVINELENQLNCLEDKLCKVKKLKTGRKEEVLSILQEHIRISILDISNIMGISTKNVSSQLTYLRTDGHNISTDSKGRKFLEVTE